MWEVFEGRVLCPAIAVFRIPDLRFQIEVATLVMRSHKICLSNQYLPIEQIFFQQIFF